VNGISTQLKKHVVDVNGHFYLKTKVKKSDPQKIEKKAKN